LPGTVVYSIVKPLVTVLALAAVTAATAAAATQTLTLTPSATVVTYGKTVTLTGQLAPAKANQNITIDGTACGTTRAAKVTTAKTAATGAFSATVTPTVGTTYQATLKNVKSPAVAIAVRPLLQLTKGAHSTWTAKVTAGQSLTGKAVLFQRYAKLRKRWVQVKRVVLGTATPGTTKPTVIMTASFKAKLARGTRVRLAISKAQAGPCYVAATSASLRA
jgi:hypothetical protein